MTITVRWIRVLVPVLLLSACAGYRYQSPGGTPRTGLPTPTVKVRFFMAAGECTKENTPGPLYGVGGQDVTWLITNECEDRVIVRIRKVKQRGSGLFGGGPYPFTVSDPNDTVPANSVDHAFRVTVKESSQVPISDRGFHVYTYTFTWQWKNVKHDDPEIIIEWP